MSEGLTPAGRLNAMADALDAVADIEGAAPQRNALGTRLGELIDRILGRAEERESMAPVACEKYTYLVWHPACPEVAAQYGALTSHITGWRTFYDTEPADNAWLLRALALGLRRDAARLDREGEA